MATPINGAGAFLQKLTYEDLTDLRSATYDVSAFMNIKRGLPGMKLVFTKILPPTVKKGVIATGGCGKLPDPDCMAAFEFTAQITNKREVNTISTSCDWQAMTNAQKAEFQAEAVSAFSIDEMKEAMNFIATSVTETTVDPNISTNARVFIERMILETLKKSNVDLGTLSARRQDLVVIVSPDVESSLNEIGLACCELDGITPAGAVNAFKVNNLAVASYDFLPVGVDVLVYDKRLFFGVTQCEDEIIQRELNQAEYAPGTVQTYGSERYGFQKFQYPAGGSATGTIGNVFVGVKSTAYITV